jgi:hypothetical protein
MLSYEKQWGFKFDMLVLDYLDCVESHKSRQDRNESELTVIKGFEALSSDFDIPAWTAIQSNRTGFGAEFVEANQTGGSIKRVQKAHFFMSVAKTPAQQEANFANIRIIKARFAKDGQTFEDCVFNNDTMKIIIDDPRYRYTKNYKNLKHHDDADVERLEKKADSLMEKSSDAPIHAAISKHSDNAIIGKLNSDAINDLLHQNKQPEDNDDIKPQPEFSSGVEKIIPVQPMEAPDGTGISSKMDIVYDAESDERKMEMPKEFPNIDNIHISTTRTDLSKEEIQTVLEIVNEAVGESDERKMEMPEKPPNLLELDESEDIEILDDGISDGISDGVNEGVNEGVSDGVKDDLLDFSGDTTTETVGEPEVVETPPPTVAEEFKSVNDDMDEIMKQILATDPDAAQGEDRSLGDMLVKKREYQQVKKKE